MGCNNSKSSKPKQYQNTTANDENNNNNQIHKHKTKEVDDIKNLHLESSLMVGEKTSRIQQDYNFLNNLIGKGAYAEVKKVVHKQSQMVRAVKIINKKAIPRHDHERLQTEVEILKSLDHPNILKVYEFYQDSRYFYIVTELCTGGELFDRIMEEKFFTETKAADTMRQILQAVNYCHQNKIIHRDLKPENILFESKDDNSQLKIIDFGTSIEYDPNSKLTQKIGTPYYIAPEVLEKKYDNKCDIWSCGVLLYILLCGYPPFNGSNDTVVLDKVKTGRFSFDTEEWKYVSEEAKEFIKKLLEKDPSKRYSAEQALNDIWIRRHSTAQQTQMPTLVNSLKNMKSFRAEKKLQQAILIFFVNNLAISEEKSELLKMFKILDANGDGKLSRQEIINGYKKILHAGETEAELDKIINIIDKNNSGYIDYTEWLMATINRDQLLSKQRLETAFKMFDKDGNGSLSLQEVKDIFGAQLGISENVFKEILKEVDENSDGQIEFKEFKQMMLNLADHEQKNLIQEIKQNEKK